MSARWTLAERSHALARAEQEGVDLLVIGGGITGAGVLRDAASRGLRCLLVERFDFASGTSSRSSKMLHGGLRYIAEGHLGVTYRSCLERDRLAAQNPHLVRRAPFLFPVYAGGSVRPWQLRTALLLYRLLAGLRSSSRYRILSPEEALAFAPGLRRRGLLAAGLYFDALVDDARLVIDSLKSARELGGEAANHVEAVGFRHDENGRLAAVKLRDRLSGRTLEVATSVVVNAAGPAVERVLGLDHPIERPRLRPAKGVHVVIPADRIPARGAVTFEARDGRHLFLCPWEDVALIGTTDTFSEEIDEPLADPEDVRYLLDAANDAFPSARLRDEDIVGVFAGVRPLVADAESQRPPSAVSREHRIEEHPCGLVSVAGGKLTLYRYMGERVVDRAVRYLSSERRRELSRSRTAELPLREDRFERAALEREIEQRFGLPHELVARLVSTWGEQALALLAEAPSAWRVPIGRSHYCYAEIPWSFRTECPATLCDLLERRLRLALFAADQGVPELRAVVAVAAQAAGWSAERARDEAASYVEVVRRRYRPPAPVIRERAQSAA